MRTAAAPTLAVAAVASTLASARQVSAVQRLVSGLTLTLLLATPARAGWVSHGPEGGVTPALAVDATTNRSTVYAGPAGGGVFKTTNGGGSWSAVNTGLTAPVVLVVAVDAATRRPSPSTVAGGSGGAVSTGTAGGGAGELAVDATTSPSTAYAAAAGGGVFKTTNGGGSWSAVNTGVTAAAFVFALAVDATTSPSTVYAGTGGD